MHCIPIVLIGPCEIEYLGLARQVVCQTMNRLGLSRHVTNINRTVCVSIDINNFPALNPERFCLLVVNEIVFKLSYHWLLGTFFICVPKITVSESYCLGSCSRLQGRLDWDSASLDCVVYTASFDCIVNLQLECLHIWY